MKLNSKGELVHGFRGRPRLQESLAKRASKLDLKPDSEPPVSLAPPPTNIDDVQEHDLSSGGTIKNTLSNSNSNSMLSISDLTHSELVPNEELNSNSKMVNGLDSINDFHIFQDIFPTFLSEADLPPFINDFNVSPSQTVENKDTTKLSYVEENMMLKHFFKRLLPLLDAHPSTPWPQLALKYCDFEIAKTCFISLACIHLYETKGAKEFYEKGMTHINNTMEYLIDYLRDKSFGSIDDDGRLDVDQIVKNLKLQPLEKQRSNFFVILLLIHVHLLFSVLESGRSALVRTFFQLFSAIVSDSTFKVYLEKIEESSTLIVQLSWFDTITAVVSPDCRLPYCDESWYGDKDSVMSTSQLMGCPGEIFRCISKLCELRKCLKEQSLSSSEIQLFFNSVKDELLKYREFVIIPKESDESDIILRIKCAQCWSIAVLVNFYRLVKPEEKNTIKGLILEFISVYESMESTSPHVTQMVWPVFTIACICETEFQRRSLRSFIDILYTNAKMGTIHTIGVIAEECWSAGKSWEDILSSKEWLLSGIDYLVV